MQRTHKLELTPVSILSIHTQISYITYLPSRSCNFFSRRSRSGGLQLENTPPGTAPAGPQGLQGLTGGLPGLAGPQQQQFVAGQQFYTQQQLQQHKQQQLQMQMQQLNPQQVHMQMRLCAPAPLGPRGKGEGSEGRPGEALLL